MIAAPPSKVWIDLENTPHIPFFAPIIRELQQRGHCVVLTARDAYQTCEMADLFRFSYQKIGRHYGQKILLKGLGLGIRSTQLVSFIRRERPALALSHGSRSQVVACNLLRVPSVMLDDYEHSHGVGFGYPTWTILPQALAATSFPHHPKTKLLYYSGIKEDVYAQDLVPDSRILAELGLPRSGIVLVTVRPPATEAHYHNPESEILFETFMERAITSPETHVVLLPRNHRQATQLQQQHPKWFAQGKVIIPKNVVNGLNLLWHSDLVVSGGGTMNREAAALGVPVYSIFRGRIGAVDQQLQTEKRLTLIESPRDAVSIPLQPRDKTRSFAGAANKALPEIVEHLERILAQSCG